jgi:hypothetical protein
MKTTIKRAWAAWLLVPFLFSCATYNKSMNDYYANVKEHNYDKALRSLEKNRLIKKNRNALLYNMEMGRLYFLKNDAENSNLYLNRADGMIESNGKSFADIAVANLLNPMQQAYRGEDFEQFMVHYYKALNYAALMRVDDAVVEARRITLSANTQNNKFANKNNRYSNDAFALNLQGMIYEMAGDVNNAFIAYRNAADLYLKADNDYYGVKMPLQLQKDLLRTAAAMGFTSEGQRYEKLFNVGYTESNSVSSELILFLEEGQAPVKQEKNFVLTAGANGLSSFNYVDPNGLQSNFNFNAGSYGISENRLSSLRAFRLSLPTYTLQYDLPASITVSNDGALYNPQLAQNLNSIALNILKERFVTEMANALARQLTKKVVEKGAQSIAESIAKNTRKKESSDTTAVGKQKQNKENEQRAERAGEVAGFVMNMFNTATEKADTRNWQSLPAFVSYVRMPLHEGENIITVSYNGQPVTLKVSGKPGLQMKSVALN